MGWNFGCGLPIDAALKGRCLEQVLDAVTFYCEEATEDALLANPVTVALRVLESMVEDEEQSCLAVARGLLSTLSSAKLAEKRADRHTPREDNMKRAVAEEEAWQDAALSLIDGWKGVAIRDMFDPVGEKPPDWLLDWRMRRAR
jgi:phage-related tail protein